MPLAIDGEPSCIVRIWAVRNMLAKRMAMNRMKDGAETLPPLIWDDFEQALKRNQICL